MLNLIIVDDETIIRETISQIIDWKSLDIHLSGTCKNGVEAWNLIQNQTPDIVLTDIKMPGLSGLDLIQKTTEANLMVEFILLSGYADFEYAKTAIQYKVHNYLLKPCNENQIIDAVRRASEDIIRRKKIEELIPDNVLTVSPGTLPYKGYIRQTIAYVDAHLSEPDLSLKWIAENVLFMNVDYISREFYRQTGQRFTEYLTEVRIARAQLLLRTCPETKIADIAEQVGFGNNPQYFSHLFKNATGVTPRTYLKQFP